LVASNYRQVLCDVLAAQIKADDTVRVGNETRRLRSFPIPYRITPCIVLTDATQTQHGLINGEDTFNRIGCFAAV